MPIIEMFFDHTCPYCNRGHGDLMALLPKYPQIQMKWIPIEAHPRLEEPDHLPYEDLAVQGALFVKSVNGDEKAYHERIYKARFVEKKKVDEISVLVDCAKDLGLDAQAFERALTERTFVQEQLAANDYAYEENKVWAVPTYVCGEKRLDAKEGIGVHPDDLDAFLRACSQEA